MRVEFAGGMETLFHNKKTLQIHDAAVRDVRSLIRTLRDSYFDAETAKEDLFLSPADGSVRAGILVLVNDVDWELEGGLDAPLSSDDTVTFISTLHGG